MKQTDIKFNQVFLDVIDELLSDAYSDIHRKEDFLSFFYFFEHHIAYSNDDWVQFDMHFARKLFGRFHQSWKLPAIIKTLTERDILQASPYYFDLLDKRNSTTRKYKYTEEFERQIITDNIRFSIGCITQKTYERLIKTNKPEKYYLLAQYEILNSHRFNIDLDKASQWLIKQFRTRSITKNSYQVNMRVILSLDNKDNIYVKQDEITGRVFTNFNCMKRELREYCTIDGEKLNSLDLKSAQPTFLAHQLLNQYPADEDVQRFYTIVTQEDIYDFLDQHYFYREYYEEFEMPTTLRDQSKVEFMRWIFSDSRGSAGYSNAIKNEFPNVWRIVQNGKNQYRKNDSNYAIELQKIEAKIFIEDVREIFSHGVLSVHDSLYFKSGLKDLVEDDLRESLIKNKIKSFKLKFA